MRVYIFKDGMMIASTADRDSAIDLIGVYQVKETHPILKANFSIIEGNEECILYKQQTRKR